MAGKEAPDRADREARAMVATQQFGKLLQRHVDLRLDRGRMTSRYASIRCERRSPPFGLAVVAPVSCQAFSQRTAVAIAMPNRSAAALRDIPSSTAAMTRTRRSSDNVFPIAAGPHSSTTVNQTLAASGIAFDS